MEQAVECTIKRAGLGFLFCFLAAVPCTLSCTLQPGTAKVKEEASRPRLPARYDGYTLLNCYS